MDVTHDKTRRGGWVSVRLKNGRRAAWQAVRKRDHHDEWWIVWPGGQHQRKKRRAVHVYTSASEAIYNGETLKERKRLRGLASFAKTKEDDV